jgi:tRNA A-37 threonylcarbamoyl transferase component Bud32/carbon monoxide dehydrogenase subunit G
MHIDVKIDLPASPEIVWAYLRDITSHTEWMHDAVSIEFSGSQTEGVGTTFDCLTAVGPLRTNDRMEITSWEPDREMGVRHEGVVTGEGRFTLTPAGSPTGSETRFSWSESLSLPWFFGGRLGEIVASPVLTMIWRRNLRGLRARIIELEQAETWEPGVDHLIGVGRDSEVHTRGSEQVVRIAHDGRDLTHEAEAMQLVRAAGYPAPAFVEQPDPSTLVMQRLHGPTMLEELTAKPWKLVPLARTLARLHHELGLVDAPPQWTRVSPGDSVVHLDLHPDNVKMTPNGPVVFDWSNAATGNPAFDAALTYVILRTGEPDANPAAKAVIASVRRQFAKAFLKAFGEAEALAHLRSAAELRMLNPHLTPAEREAAFALARGELD